MAQLKKPTPKRPMAPRIPSTGVKKPLSKASDAKAKFEKDFKSGKMKVNAGEIISPGKIVAKLATKVAAKAVAKTAQIAKNSVKVKPAAKQVGNPPNDIKAWEYYISSVSRGAPGRGPAGKAKATRVANSKIAKKTVPKANEPSRIPEIPARATVKINTDPTKPKGIFGALKKKLATADTPANRAKAQANTRGLKAANKPLSKGNKKLVTQIKQQTGYIAMDRRPTPPTVAAALKKGPKGSFITEAKKIAMQEARSEGPAKKISAAQKMLNDKAARRRNLNK